MGVQEDEGGGIEIIFHFADIYQNTAHYCYCIKGYLWECWIFVILEGNSWYSNMSASDSQCMVSYTRVIIKIYGPLVVNYGKPKGYMRNISYCPSLLVGALLIWFSVFFNQISSLMILFLHYSCFYLAWTKVQHEYLFLNIYMYLLK